LNDLHLGIDMAHWSFHISAIVTYQIILQYYINEVRKSYKSVKDRWSTVHYH